MIFFVGIFISFYIKLVLLCAIFGKFKHFKPKHVGFGLRNRVARLISSKSNCGIDKKPRNSLSVYSGSISSTIYVTGFSSISYNSPTN